MSLDNSSSQPAYGICTRCVMDTSDRYIEFDVNGICNHCRNFDSNIKPYLLSKKEKEAKLETILTEIRSAGSNNKYDCVVGLSGGKDSSYVSYLAQKHNLRTLIVHFDNGWDSELAIKNIENILRKTGFDYYNYIVDWDEFRDLQLAYFKASVVDIEATTDLGIFSLLPKVAKKMGARYILMGQNLETESIMGKAWNFPFKNYRANLLAIHKKYGKIKLKTFPMITPIEKIIHKTIYDLKIVNILEYEDCNYERIETLLKDTFDWRDYDIKHGESVFTRFYQEYVLPKKFGIEKRRAHLSSLICSEQMTRDSALIQLEKKIASTAELLEEKQYVIGKWQLDEAEFDRIMLLPPVSHYEYPVKGEPMIDLFWAKLARPIIFLFSCSLIILRRFHGVRG